MSSFRMLFQDDCARAGLPRFTNHVADGEDLTTPHQSLLGAATNFFLAFNNKEFLNRFRFGSRLLNAKRDIA